MSESNSAGNGTSKSQSLFSRSPRTRRDRRVGSANQRRRSRTPRRSRGGGVSHGQIPSTSRSEASTQDNDVRMRDRPPPSRRRRTSIYGSSSQSSTASIFSRGSGFRTPRFRVSRRRVPTPPPIPNTNDQNESPADSKVTFPPNSQHFRKGSIN